MCREISFDVLLLDNRLGAEQGIDVIARLREVGSGRPTCTILISGDAPDRFRTWLVAGDVDAFLQKPVRPFELQATMQACLAPRAALSAAS